MAKLFLSYSRKDAARAQRITDWLEREGHDAWRDEDDIGGGASFSSEIEKALKDCDAVLVLWSAESVQSTWVRDEAGFGRDHGKLIPISLDGTEPPLGFRQFQSIDLSKWKGRGEPPAAERIRRAIERLAERQPLPAALSTPTRHLRTGRRWAFVRAGMAAVVLALVGAAVLGFFAWQRSGRDQGVTIAVLPSPISPDRAAAADYANVAAADMAAFLPTHFDRVVVISPADAIGRTSGYRFLISANRHGNGADASLTMSDFDGSSILWSKSWSVADLSAVDLAQAISRFASQAGFCLMQARGGSQRLDQPALGLFISACVGVPDPDRSDADLLATFERVVKLAPGFAQGWGDLSVARSIAAEAQENGPRSTYLAAVRQAREAIAIARKLDPRGGQAYLAEYHLVRNDHVRALAVLEKGAELDPTNATLQANRSDALRTVGRIADSVEAAHRAIELEPTSPFVRSHYIFALAHAGQFSRAKADIADARKKWPNDPAIDGAEFAFQYRYGDPRAAEALLPKVVDYGDAQMVRNRKLIAARLDPSPAKINEAIEAFRSAQSSNPRDRNDELLALGLFGRIEETYQLLGDPSFEPFVATDILFRPEFATVRADPRFMEVAARLGLVRYWRESGNWPDFCSSEKLRYECRSEAAKYGS